MNITFLGAARTVTGSQHLLTINGKKLLLDCGLYQGSPQEARERNTTFDLEPKSLDAVILSHAHIDHCGNLPNLVKQGFEGPIYCTPVTAHLADLLMRDSGSIQESEAEEIAEAAESVKAVEGRQPDGPEMYEPLYTAADAAEVKQYFMPTLYNTPFEVFPGVTASLVDAGHIFGSAAVQIDVEEKGNKKRRVWFSGDVGRQNLPLVRDPVMPEDVNVLIMDCTYGDKDHGDPLEAYDRLREAIAQTIDRGGRVIIPAFAVGRTQEIVYYMHQMIERGEIPEIPVYVDSPLASEASKIFTDHPEYLDDEARKFMNDAESRSALGFEMLRYIESSRESRQVHTREDPMVIISTSGMMETGRVLHHTRFSIEDPRDTILLVSYQAPNTLGRALQNGEKQIRIMGRVYERKANVVTISGLSAHAGQSYLVDYAKAVKSSLEKTFLVHGEDTPAEALQEKLKDAGIEKTYYPYLRQSMEI